MSNIRSKMQAEQTILDRIQRRKFKWYGHLLRREDSCWPVDTAWLEEKRKTITIMEEPSHGFHEKQKFGKRLTSLAFGSGWTALGCIDPNNNITVIY